jgi:hypothetical protein
LRGGERAGFDALLAIAVHRVRRHRHDPRPARQFDVTDDVPRR